MNQFFFLFNIFCYSCSLCQTSSISGRVLDLGSNQPLPFAQVILMSEKDTLSIEITGFDGKYSFQNCPVGTYQIVAKYVGFRDSTLTVYELEKNLVYDIELVQIPYEEVPCVAIPFDKKGKCPICFKNDETIPVLYGYPSDWMMKKSEKGKIKLGGCVIFDDCIYYWFCQRDDRWF